MSVQSLINACALQSPMKLKELKDQVKECNLSKAELWKGNFNGQSIGDYLGGVYGDSPFKVQLEILKMLRIMQCKNEQKNKDLFNTIIASCGIKGVKWFKKFTESKDMLRLLGEMFNKYSIELTNGQIFFKNDVFSIFQTDVVQELNVNRISMADIDGTKVTFYLGAEVMIISLISSGMAKMKKWLNTNQIKLTTVSKVTKAQLAKLKKGLNNHKEVEPMMDYASLIKKRKLTDSEPSMQYETPMKKQKRMMDQTTLLPNKFKKEETTLVETPKPKAKAIVNKSELLLSDDDYALQQDVFIPRKFASKLLSDSSVSNTQESAISDDVFVLKEWHESMQLELESFFAQKQQEMTFVKSYLEDKKRIVQEQLVASLMPKHSEKLLDIIAGEDIQRQRKKNMIQLKDSVSQLLQAWSSC